MLHFFHGENTDASRKELVHFKEKYAREEIIELNGGTVTPQELIQASESGSIFEQKRLVIVENLFSKLNKKAKEFSKYLELVKNIPKTTEMIFWETKEFTKTFLNELPKETDIAIFRPDRSVFAFVESLAPGRSALMLEQFSGALNSDSAEMIFAMLVRQIRYLIIVKDIGKRAVDLSPWQIAKFIRQAQLFTLPKLLQIYEQLLEIDVKIKTGGTPFTLTEELKLFLIEI